MDLSEFLLARIGDDERDASELARHLTRWAHERELNGPDGSQGSIVASLLAETPSDPARVLADCESKRRIVEEFTMIKLLDGWHEIGPAEGAYAKMQVVLRLLALPYSEHPAYDPSWRPS